MNAKKCKQLRREAGYKAGRKGTKADRRNLVPQFNADEIMTGMVNDPKTNRAKYRQLKREHKAAEAA
jgi:hypothetical protein